MKNNKNRTKDISIDLVLERRERSYSFGEPRVSSHASFTLDAPFEPDASTLNTARKEILEVVQKFESTSLAGASKAHGTLALDTYTGLKDGKVVEVTRKAASDLSKSASALKYAKQTKSKVTIVTFSTHFIDPNTASIHYSIEQGGRSGNCAAMLVREKGAWKIAAYAQHPTQK